MSDIDKLIDITCELQRIIGARIRQSITSHGGTLQQTIALLFLHDNPGASTTELATALSASLSAATQLIDRLITTNVVRRSENPNDRRITHLYLTKQGEQDYNEFRAARHNALKAIFQTLDEQDVQELMRLHSHLLNRLLEAHNS